MQPPSLPLSKRPIDIALIIFFIINLFFITYIVDLEQLVITDPQHFSYPLWPPAKLVDLVHWYGRNFDPVLMARPWAAVMLTNVTIILFEEINGEHATPQLFRVLLANAAWAIFPIVVLYRMWRSIYPFAAADQLK